MNEYRELSPREKYLLAKRGIVYLAMYRKNKKYGSDFPEDWEKACFNILGRKLYDESRREKCVDQIYMLIDRYGL